MQPLLLSDVLGIKRTRSRYDANAYAGFIYFSGGLVRLKQDLGVQVSTRKIELKSSQAMRDDVTNWFAATLESYAREEGLRVRQVAGRARDFRAITRQKDFRISPTEERDNINLPRWVHTPGQTLPPALKARAAQARYVLVPIINYYYAHNAGWFHGQDWGCNAGVRMGIQVLIYDLQTAALVYHVELEGKRVSRRGSLNSNRYQQELGLLKLELAARLRRLLPEG